MVHAKYPLKESVEEQIQTRFEEAKEVCIKAITEQLTGGAVKLESSEATKTKIRHQFNELQKQFGLRLSAGFNSLVDYFLELSNQDPEKYDLSYLLELQKLKYNNEAILDAVSMASEDDEAKDASLKKMCGISGTAFDIFKEVVQELMNVDKFKEASDVLFFLIALDPFDPSLMTALGCAEYHRQNYEAAKYAFEMSQIADPSNPMPFLYDAHCYEDLKDPAQACKLVENALAIMGDRPEFAEWIESSKQYLRELKKVA